MKVLVKILASSRFLRSDLDYHLVRASMVLIFVLFGYQKWFDYEAQTLIPFISNGPLTFWMYPVFGIQGASWFLGVTEWLTAALLFLGFWNKKLGILGALGSCATFIGTVTIIPFMPNGWDASAGFPALRMLPDNRPTPPWKRQRSPVGTTPAANSKRHRRRAIQTVPQMPFGRSARASTQCSRRP